MDIERTAFLKERQRRIERFLAYRHWDQKTLAERVGIHKTYMSHILHGHRIGSAETLAQMERVSRGRLKVVDMVPPPIAIG